MKIAGSAPSVATTTWRSFVWSTSIEGLDARRVPRRLSVRAAREERDEEEREEREVAHDARPITRRATP